MNVLLTGACGQLGVESLPLLHGWGEVTSVDRLSSSADPAAICLDLGDLDAVEDLLERIRPDLIVNAAAYTAVDRAEVEAETAFRINADLPGCLAHWAQRNDSLLLHYSTDYVFSGNAERAYRETDATGPLNVYGESKLAGEAAVAATGCRHLLLRTSWVYSSHGNNFVRTMLRLGRERDMLSVVADQTGRPTWARNLARVSRDLVAQVLSDPSDEQLLGTWHYCDSDALSWYDFALAIFRTAQATRLLEAAPQVTAVSSEQFPQAAKRPHYSVLDTSAIAARFGIESAGLEESLTACLEEIRAYEQG